MGEVKRANIFRYPGGKYRLAKILEANVRASGVRTLIEPFAGGASAGIAVLRSGAADKLVLVELDHRVAAFWKTVFNSSEKIRKDFIESVREYGNKIPFPDSEKLMDSEKVKDYSRKYVEDFEQVIKPLEESNLALWTLIKNRCSFGGYLNGGFLVKGFLKNVIDGQRCDPYYLGLRSQWNTDNLIRSIEEIQRFHSQVVFHEGSAFDYFKRYPDAFAFVDPPYSVSENDPGRCLYDKNDVDHEALFKILSERPGPWLATYNNSPEVLKLSDKYGFKSEKIKMNRLHADTDAEGKVQYHELIIYPREQKFISKGENNMTEEVMRKAREVSVKTCANCNKEYKADKGNKHKNGDCVKQANENIKIMPSISVVFPIDILRKERDRLISELVKNSPDITSLDEAISKLA